MSEPDPFTGVGKFLPEKSQLTTPAPWHWIQTICADATIKREGNCIYGTGKQNGQVSFLETVTASPPDHIITIVYAVFAGERQAASGTAVFKKMDT